MNSLFTVISYTMKDMLKRKSFIISTIIILLLIVVGFNIPNIISSFGGDDYKEKLLIVDSENIFDGNLNMLNELDLGYEVSVQNIEKDAIKDKIENEDIDSAIILEKVDNNIKMNYIVEDASMFSEIPQDLVNAISTIYTNIQINKLHLTEEEIASITPSFEFNIEQIKEQAEGNVFVIMILSIFLFYAIYFCAYQVSSSITIEKTSKIIETLVTSTSPKTIVLGKTIGIGIVGLLQLILIIGVSLLSANLFLDHELINLVLDTSNITLYLGIITIIYFILGYFTFALLYALTGSTVSKPEDIQSANSPIAIIAVAAFYLSYFTMMNPTSNLNTFASMFPLSSPFCMPFRVMMGLASLKDVIISIILLLVTILIIAKVTIKIYSNAIINYGTKLSIKDIINMYKSK